MSLPSQEELQSLLDYDPETGRLFWKPRSSGWPGFNTRYAGQEAFTAVDSGGYRIGSVLKIRHRAHRVIWKLVHGTEPEQIDHEDGDRQNNRLKNLRPVTDAQNKKNTKRRSDNRSGTVGVGLHSDGKFRARIGTEHLGLFDTIEEAVAVRKAAEVTHNYHQNHGRAV